MGRLNVNQKQFVAAGVAGMIFCLVFVPWKTTYHSGGTHNERSIGYAWIGDPPDRIGAQVDHVRIVLEVIAVLLVTSLAVWLAAGESKPGSSFPDAARPEPRPASLPRTARPS